jgi:hypothetical protein
MRRRAGGCICATRASRAFKGALRAMDLLRSRADPIPCSSSLIRHAWSMIMPAPCAVQKA